MLVYNLKKSLFFLISDVIMSTLKHGFIFQLRFIKEIK